MLCQSCPHQFVVDVILVGLEERQMVTNSNDNDANGIEYRHNQKGEGY
jgi:hypothetical protein